MLRSTLLNIAQMVNDVEQSRFGTRCLFPAASPTSIITTITTVEGDGAIKRATITTCNQRR
jgi:hypothetical protein